MTTVNIENNTARIIVLFATDAFPEGVRLVPGKNSVPVKYLDEMRGRMVSPQSGPAFSPGVRLLEDLQEKVRIVTSNGTHSGPQITIFTKDQTGREDGPPHPASLETYKVEVALAMVSVTSDKTALKSWTKDPREEVAKAAKAKLTA